jgi:hypothetical protein
MADPGQSSEIEGVKWSGIAPSNAGHVAVLDTLSKVYGDDHKRLQYTTPPLPAPSEILRNDLIFHSAGEVERHWAERTYVALANESGGRDVQGFVHGRSHGMLRELAGMYRADKASRAIPRLIEAYLTAPPPVCPDPGQGHVIQDYLADYLFGDPYVPVPVTPFCRPHRVFSGMCAQAAAHMCLVLCSKRWDGAALGTFDIHRLATAGEGGFRLRTFRVRGLSTSQIAAVFSSSSARLAAIRIIRPLWPNPEIRDRKMMYTAKAIGAELMGFIASDCPVILAVNYNRWATFAEAPAGDPDDQHGIVLIGYRIDHQMNSTKLIIHDSATRPYHVLDLLTVLNEVAQKYGESERDRPYDTVHCVAAVPKGVTLAPIGAGMIARPYLHAGVDWLSRDSLRCLRYQLVPVGKVGRHIAHALVGRPDANIPTAREVESVLLDEGVRHLWRVTRIPQPGLRSTPKVFVDAGVWSDDYGNPGLKSHRYPLCHVVCVYPHQSIRLLMPTGADTWRMR